MRCTVSCFGIVLCKVRVHGNAGVEAVFLFNLFNFILKMAFTKLKFLLDRSICGINQLSEIFEIFISGIID